MSKNETLPGGGFNQPFVPGMSPEEEYRELMKIINLHDQIRSGKHPLYKPVTPLPSKGKKPTSDKASALLSTADLKGDNSSNTLVDLTMQNVAESTIPPKTTNSVTVNSSSNGQDKGLPPSSGSAIVSSSVKSIPIATKSNRNMSAVTKPDSIPGLGVEADKSKETTANGALEQKTQVTLRSTNPTSNTSTTIPTIGKSGKEHDKMNTAQLRLSHIERPQRIPVITLDYDDPVTSPILPDQRIRKNSQNHVSETKHREKKVKVESTKIVVTEKQRLAAQLQQEHKTIVEKLQQQLKDVKLEKARRMESFLEPSFDVDAALRIAIDTAGAERVVRERSSNPGFRNENWMRTNTNPRKPDDRDIRLSTAALPKPPVVDSNARADSPEYEPSLNDYGQGFNSNSVTANKVQQDINVEFFDPPSQSKQQKQIESSPNENVELPSHFESLANQLMEPFLTTRSQMISNDNGVGHVDLQSQTLQRDTTSTPFIAPIPRRPAESVTLERAVAVEEVQTLPDYQEIMNLESGMVLSNFEGTKQSPNKRPNSRGVQVSERMMSKNAATQSPATHAHQEVTTNGRQSTLRGQIHATDRTEPLQRLRSPQSVYTSLNVAQPMLVPADRYVSSRHVPSRYAHPNDHYDDHYPRHAVYTDSMGRILKPRVVYVDDQDQIVLNPQVRYIEERRYAPPLIYRDDRRAFSVASTSRQPSILPQLAPLSESERERSSRNGRRESSPILIETPIVPRPIHTSQSPVLHSSRVRRSSRSVSPGRRYASERQIVEVPYQQNVRPLESSRIREYSVMPQEEILPPPHRLVTAEERYAPSGIVYYDRGDVEQQYYGRRTRPASPPLPPPRRLREEHDYAVDPRHYRERDYVYPVVYTSQEPRRLEDRVSSSRTGIYASDLPETLPRQTPSSSREASYR